MPIVLEICQGTTCFVMGASEIMSLPEFMPPAWRDKVEIRGTTCLDRCKSKYRKAPCVRLDGEVVEAATLNDLLARLAEKLGGAPHHHSEESR